MRYLRQVNNHQEIYDAGYSAGVERAAQEAEGHRANNGKFAWVVHEIAAAIRKLKAGG